MNQKSLQLQIANAPCSWGVLEFEEHSAAGYATRACSMKCAPPDTPARNSVTGASCPPNQVSCGTHSQRDRSRCLGLRPGPLAGSGGVPRRGRVGNPDGGTTRDAGFPSAFIVLADDIAASPERTAAAGRVRRSSSAGAVPQVFAANAERIARAVREATGLRTVFHHHCASYIETTEEISDLMNRTDPDVLGLCLDTGHLTYAGGDPVAAAREFGSRIWHLHLKDCSRAIADRARANGWNYNEAVRKGVFCELGQGSVNFPAVLEALDRAGFSGWAVVEQDVLPSLGTPAASAARNRDFIRTLGF